MKDKPKDDPGVPTTTIPYLEGNHAFRDGASLDDCPYRQGRDGRVGWLTGHNNARLNKKLGPIFERHGVGPL